MKIEKAINILENHNKWRRGDDTIEMVYTWELGEAIDMILSEMKGFLVFQNGIRELPKAAKREVQ